MPEGESELEESLKPTAEILREGGLRRRRAAGEGVWIASPGRSAMDSGGGVESRVSLGVKESSASKKGSGEESSSSSVSSMEGEGEEGRRENRRNREVGIRRDSSSDHERRGDGRWNKPATHGNWDTCNVETGLILGDAWPSAIQNLARV